MIQATRPLRALALLLILAAAGRAHALMEIEDVDPKRAKELGIDVTPKAAGPEAVRIVLEFDIKGDLKDFHRVDLEMREGGKLLLAATLDREKSKPGHVMVSFTADRAKLDQITLRIVTGVPMSMVGHDLRVKDFVDPAKLR
jgi:hypothetical protein